MKLGCLSTQEQFVCARCHLPSHPAAGDVLPTTAAEMQWLQSHSGSFSRGFESSARNLLTVRLGVITSNSSDWVLRYRLQTATGKASQRREQNLGAVTHLSSASCNVRPRESRHSRRDPRRGRHHQERSDGHVPTPSEALAIEC